MMVLKRITRIILYSICALLLLSGAVYGAVVTEIEPNNDLDHAQFINAGDTINGKMDGDNVVTDYYKLTLPQAGIVTLTLSGYTDGQFNLGAGDFGAGWGTGSVKGENGQPVKFSFSAPKNKQGYISVSVNTVSGVTGGNNGCYWAIIELNTDGPYYIMSEKPSAEAPHCVPSSYEGKPVLPTLPYQLDVSLQPVPDQYEPNNNKDEVTQSIPIGQEITAYLFNEWPQPMRGTPGYDSSSSFGGENDIDIYRTSLSQPDTVNVQLSDFPQNANSKIRITQSDGQWEDSANDATQFSYKVTKPGDVFIEISKGTGTDNLVYSTTPYKMLVTTGGGTTQMPVTPTVTPTVTITPTVTSTPTKPSGGELVTNGDFSSGLGGWTIMEWFNPSDGKGEVTAESDGIRFLSKSGNNNIGIMRTLNDDVSGCSALNLRATIKADEQTLGGTGFNGREAPIAIFARYTDMNGVLHGNLGEDPKDPNRMFWTGFYFMDPTGSSITDFGIKTQKGEWYNYEFDLMKLSPKPKTIDIIGAEGAGWPPRDGKVKSISLTCTAAGETPRIYISPTYTPAISATGPQVTTSGARDFAIGISPTSLTVNPGDTLRLTLTVMPSGGFNEPVDIYVKVSALGQERDLGKVTTIYPPYQPFVFENPVPSEIPKGTTIYGYVTAKGGGLEHNADTVTVKVPGFEILPMIAAVGLAMFLIRRRK
ncbi:MAG: hypothetical protein WCE94_03570 [Candidatus Methanoperedens sp.]